MTYFDRSRAVVELAPIEATSSPPTLISDGESTQGAGSLYLSFHDDTDLTSLTVQIWGCLVDASAALVAWAPIADANYTITAGGGATDAIDVRPYNRWYLEVTALTGTGVGPAPVASVPCAYRVG